MEYITCANTAKLIRAALKESFPAVKFSVTSKTYSGGASISITYFDGPTQKQVEQVISVFEGAYFDGMQDYKGSNYANLDGKEVRFGADFIFVNRKFTSPFLTGVVTKACNEYSFGNAVTFYVSQYDQSASISDVADDSDSIRRGFSAYDVRRILAQKIADTSLCDTLPSKTATRVFGLGDDGYGHGCVGRLAA